MCVYDSSLSINVKFVKYFARSIVSSARRCIAETVAIAHVGFTVILALMTSRLIDQLDAVIC